MHPDGQLDELIADLKVLRKGLGAQETSVPRSAGVALRQVCGVPDGAPPGVVRHLVVTALGELIGRLPEGKQPTARAVFGFNNPDNLSYTARLAWLGKVVDRDTRTMQRRADEVIYLLAELAHARDAPPATVAANDSPWHTKELKVRVLLRGPQVEVFETRRVVSHVPGLTGIEHAVSVISTAPAGGPVDLRTLGIDEIEGGEVLDPRAVSSHRVAFTLRPPAPLDSGDEHSFFFRVRVPTIAPLYCCTPEFACERFALSVGFRRENLPARIWRIDGELSMQAGDPAPAREALVADGAGEVRVVFENLRPARSYGMGWEPPT
ncbi:hypothetical protein [Umezawaea sp. Da 62-37]|uniref:hypothetical protein n=1 Tax=Umezawaea sp. Da 62-37 TaxID=3075927 RepID=UPI0028F6E194|nr:hypothetical protein [Umezawaea sp. Da 62-37]WNV83915.1 hypothetical protein RM788_37985 [Umezawaea sp. Da 62-37]